MVMKRNLNQGVFHVKLAYNDLLSISKFLKKNSPKLDYLRMQKSENNLKINKITEEFNKLRV